MEGNKFVFYKLQNMLVWLEMIIRASRKRQDGFLKACSARAPGGYKVVSMIFVKLNIVPAYSIVLDKETDTQPIRKFLYARFIRLPLIIIRQYLWLNLNVFLK
jgi:hypothetical protein